MAAGSQNLNHLTNSKPVDEQGETELDQGGTEADKESARLALAELRRHWDVDKYVIDAPDDFITWLHDYLKDIEEKRSYYFELNIEKLPHKGQLYELKAKNYGWVLLEVETRPVGPRLLVSVMGPRSVHKNEYGNDIHILYEQGTQLRAFCFEMQSVWGKALPDLLGLQDDFYPPNHAIRRIPGRFEPLPPRLRIENEKELKETVEPEIILINQAPRSKGKGGKEPIPETEFKILEEATKLKAKNKSLFWPQAMEQAAKTLGIAEFKYNHGRLRSMQNKLLEKAKNEGEKSF